MERACILSPTFPNELITELKNLKGA